MSPTVAVVGLGKIGLPIAVTLALRGHRVLGFDSDPGRMTLDAMAGSELGPDGTRPLRAEAGDGLPLRFAGLADVLDESDCVLIAVQTPHEPRYEGTTPLLDGRADFDYTALTAVLRSVVSAAPRPLEIGIMSTVLPGTTRSVVLPVTRGHEVVYCPQFVGMGTVSRDVCAPEFVLLGRESGGPSIVHEVLTGLSDAPDFTVSYETAELAKMTYNTFVSAKVTISNTVQRMAAEVGASASDVLSIVRAADRRLLGEAYLYPGMADGGPCHPRDNLALSWLARQVGMGSDIFSAIMTARQSYVEWMAEEFVRLADGRPLVILGTAFKPGTELETGSSTVLLATLLRLRGLDVRTLVDGAGLHGSDVLDTPAAYLVGSPDPAFVTARFPAGSIVVDPWHRVAGRPGVSVAWVGEP